jgi:hypothetical protein
MPLRARTRSGRQRALLTEHAVETPQLNEMKGKKIMARKVPLTEQR